MPRGIAMIVAQRQSDGVALAHPDHWSRHLAVEGHVGEFCAGLDFRFYLASLESDFVMDRMGTFDGRRYVSRLGRNAAIELFRRGSGE